MRYVDVTKKNNSESIRPKPKQKKWFRFVLLPVVFVAFGLLVYFRNEIMALFDPVSIVASVAKADLKETDGRINILILGSDKRSAGPERGVLTDTMLVASIGRVEGNVVMISLPRDLWVEAKNSQGTPYLSKINGIYSVSGAQETMNVVENVLGVPLHYYVVIDFQIFQEAIDILGGITVNVENSFDDYYYPIEGMENAPEDQRYEHVHFDAGVQEMDGVTALRYVRSRKGTNNEDTDFARSRRQQNVIMAIKDRIFSVDTLLNPAKISEMFNLYSERVDTNINAADVQGFYLISQQIKFDQVRSFVLDDRSAADEGGLLYSPSDTSLYNGAYVLIPKTGDFYQVHAYVQRYIFGD